MSTDAIKNLFRNIYRNSTCENYQNYITIVNKKSFVFTPPHVGGGFEIYLDEDKKTVRLGEGSSRGYGDGLIREDEDVEKVWEDIQKAYDRVKAVADGAVKQNGIVKQSLNDGLDNVNNLMEDGISNEYDDGDRLRNKLEMLNFVAIQNDKEGNNKND